MFLLWRRWRAFETEVKCTRPEITNGDKTPLPWPAMAHEVNVYFQGLPHCATLTNKTTCIYEPKRQNSEHINYAMEKVMTPRHFASKSNFTSWYVSLLKHLFAFSFHSLSLPKRTNHYIYISLFFSIYLLSSFIFTTFRKFALLLIFHFRIYSNSLL